MCEQKRRSPRIVRLCSTTLLLFAAVVMSCCVGNCCDARSAARMQQCNTNLSTLYDALVKYISVHGNVPRGKEGQASLDPLNDATIQKELDIAPATLRCPADESSGGSSYLLNPNLSACDLAHDSWTVIAFDRIPRHGSRSTITLVLTGNGARLSLRLPLEEQEQWRRLVMAGDRRACSPSVTADGDIRWYVGEERGYVADDGEF